MKKKTIAVVANTSWNILNFRIPLIKEIQRKYDVIVFAPKDESFEEVADIVPLIALNHLSRKGTNPIKDFLLFKELKNKYKKHKINASVHFTIKPNIYGSLAAQSLKIPSFAVVTGLGYTFLSDGLAAKAAKLLYKRAFKHNNSNIFQNGDDRQLFEELGLTPKSNTLVIPGSGIDLDKFYPMSGKDNGEEFHFLYIGRLLRDKGIIELLEAFNQAKFKNKEVFLHIVGHIDEGNPAAVGLEELNDYISQNKHIIYQGSTNDPRKFIADSDCIVLPSYREGLPRVNLEALAMAKPIITTNVAGCRDTVIHQHNGLIVEPKSVDSLKKALEQMVELPQEQISLFGERGLALAEQKFATEHINKQFLQKFNEVLDSI